jgi:hypothetical protein
VAPGRAARVDQADGVAGAGERVQAGVVAVAPEIPSGNARLGHRQQRGFEGLGDHVGALRLDVAAPVLAPELGLSPWAPGLLLSAFLWTCAAGQIGAGWIITKTGAYTVAFLAASLACICGAASFGLLVSDPAGKARHTRQVLSGR